MAEDNSIELDDVQIVEVTGRAHRDRPHTKRRRRGRRLCNCKPSLRVTTIVIFFCLVIIYSLCPPLSHTHASTRTQLGHGSQASARNGFLL